VQAVPEGDSEELLLGRLMASGPLRVLSARRNWSYTPSTPSDRAICAIRALIAADPAILEMIMC